MGISTLLLHGHAWGGLSLGVCDVKYRSKATQMMERSGAALMSENERTTAAWFIFLGKEGRRSLGGRS